MAPSWRRWLQNVSKMAMTWPQDDPKMAKMGPRCLKMAQHGPNMAQDGPNVAPTWPKVAPRWPQYGPRHPKNDPKIAQHGPKMASSWLPNGFKIATIPPSQSIRNQTQSDHKEGRRQEKSSLRDHAELGNRHETPSCHHSTKSLMPRAAWGHRGGGGRQATARQKTKSCFA
jgi:hypothetical protein